METTTDAFWKQFEHYGTPQCNEQLLIRAADSLWKAACASDTNPSVGSAVSGRHVEIGRSILSDTEKWRLQAALRREETKIGGKEYNKKVTRATKTTKGPTPGDAFPPGRGRPLR
eukprot:CAMPEP_0176424874 /NCGR_PEP_ID=MMETSP0127-20121128/11080_1 /TAXON_ID=938130 /ORGANISM="Platyophrya macrostoma, Strain WH" /LENGTH=114 /DNA_ID=CAMNT_0017805981 /DNA_START=90 /DNA_END=434 /DNA_ORIENTATION=+